MPNQKNASKKSTLTESSNENESISKKGNEPEKDLLIWKAQSRPFKKRERDFWMRLITIASIFSLILFLTEGVMPVILAISLIFLFYVLSTVEPEEIEYKITSKGIKIGDKRTDFEFLRRFWFAKKLDKSLLVFETVNLPGRLELVVNPTDEEKIRKILSSFLVEEEASPSGYDKAATWLSRKIQTE